MIWLVGAALAGDPAWMACRSRVDVASFEAAFPGVERPPLATGARPTVAEGPAGPLVLVDGAHPLAPPLPAGAVLAIAPDLPADQVVALFAALKGTSVSFLRLGTDEAPADTASPVGPSGWPAIPGGPTGPVAWAARLDGCAGVELKTASCADLPEAWRAAVADPECALTAEKAAQLQLPIAVPTLGSAISLETIAIEPGAPALQPLDPTQTWQDVKAGSAWVEMLDPVHASYRAARLSDLRAKKQVAPDYPESAKLDGGRPDLRCVADVFVAATGRVDDVVVRPGCPGDFRATTIDALSQWSWHPYEPDGTPAQFRTTVGVVYRLR